jgi:predicted ABC-type ATPase
MKLLAPNGKPSNLNATQYELVRTPAFKKWFGDWEKNPSKASKVVDQNGEPLVVYHGSYVAINEFSNEVTAHYFTDKKIVAETYGNDILSCFINIKKPVNWNANCSQFNDVERYINKLDSALWWAINKNESTSFYGIFVPQNTDGIIVEDIVDTAEEISVDDYTKNKYKYCGNIYMVSNSNQIKLANGTNTTFDSSNDDIRYQYGGENQKDNMKKTVINWSEYYKTGGEIPDNIKSKIFDANGERRIDKKAIQALTDYAENLPQTKDANLDRNGDYTASRKKLHQRIINSFKDELVCIQKKEPIAILMGGSPASGKSTFLRKYAPYLLKEEILKVDADEIRAMLPEYKGWNATSTHLETKDIVTTLLSDRTIGIPCKYDIIYDGTMNNTKSYIPLIKLLRELGYKIFIVYIDKVPEEVVKKRALERYKKSGRFVPEAVIDDFFTRGKSALNELKSKADGYMVIDGSDGNYNVIEQEGMKLPKRRLYSQLGQPIKTVSKKK